MERLDGIVLCTGVRTPIGHLAKGLASVSPEELLAACVRELLQRSSLYPQAVDGLMAGWVGQGSHAPNLARITVLQAGLPEKAHAMTLQANCVSGLEAICSAARHIAMGEGKLYLAGGTESMSTFPFAIRGSRAHRALKSLENLRAEWSGLWEDSKIQITDCIEEGLTDPVKKLSMAATAEVCAQMYQISRPMQDAYALDSYRKGLAAQNSGFYSTHVFPFSQNGILLERDEYPFLRASLVQKPQMMAKAPLLFDNSSYTMENFYRDYGAHILGKKYESGRTKGTLTLFNSVARSDGAAAVIVAEEKRARELGLEIFARLRSWGFWGVNPAHMGISPAFATALALDRAKLKFEQLDLIELHEAFAATCLSIFKVGREKYGHDWNAAVEAGKLNPNGGSLALGHPLAATGTRIVLNAMYELRRRPGARLALATACAAGGLGGAIILEKYGG